MCSTKYVGVFFEVLLDKAVICEAEILLQGSLVTGGEGEMGRRKAPGEIKGDYITI